MRCLGGEVGDDNWPEYEVGLLDEAGEAEVGLDEAGQAGPLASHPHQALSMITFYHITVLKR
jgi:hypothetical protein